jgi:hypothetical protein
MGEKEALEFLETWVPNERLRLHMKQVAGVMKAWALERESFPKRRLINGGWPASCMMPIGKSTRANTAVWSLKNSNDVILTHRLFTALPRTVPDILV